jgi:hypothetical protein
MNIDLNTEGLIPTDQPFGNAPWSYTGTETIATPPADMVDWVLVELRETATGAAFTRQAGLLYKDGSIKSADGSGDDIYFTGEFLPNEDYFVVVYARNHMPVMSADVINIPNANDSYDFSDMTNYPSYGGATAQVLLETDVYGMVAGDINGDGDLIYSGTANDRALILQRIIIETTQPYINGVTQGYFLEDLTMNSWVKYSGSLNDQRLIILNLIELEGVYDLNAVYESLVPGWAAKAPHYNPGTGPIDIMLVDNNNSLDVVLVSKEDLGETWSDNIQFTLSWDENNVMMDQMVFNYTGDYLLEPQGEIVTDNGRKYMTFVVVDWLAMPAPFNTGEQVTVLSLLKGSYSGQASKATIAQDGYALMNNGLYYMSLLGQDKTGQVLDVVTGIDDPATASTILSLYPNPVVNGQVTLSVMPEANELITITVSDVSGRKVYQETVQLINGSPLVQTINLEGLDSGTYLIRLQGTDTNKTGKIIVR